MGVRGKNLYEKIGVNDKSKFIEGAIMEYNEDLQQFTFEMYQSKEKSYGIIAIIYYCVFCGGLFLAGILYQKGFVFGMNIIYCALFAVGVMIVLIKDKNICNHKR